MVLQLFMFVGLQVFFIHLLLYMRHVPIQFQLLLHINLLVKHFLVAQLILLAHGLLKLLEVLVLIALVLQLLPLDALHLPVQVLELLPVFQLALEHLSVVQGKVFLKLGFKLLCELGLLAHEVLLKIDTCLLLDSALYLWGLDSLKVIIQDAFLMLLELVIAMLVKSLGI